MANQPGIILFRAEYQAVRKILRQDQKGDLLDALMDFSETGEVYQGDDQVVGVVFSIFSAAIQKANEKYEDRCRKNAENIEKRWKQKHDTTEYDRIQSNTNEYDRGETINSNSNSNVNTNQSDKKRFIPPTVEEVKAYCQERQNKIDPEQFVDYYSARGWEVKPGQKMRDWKASVRVWEKNGRRWNDEQRRGDHAENRIEGQREFYGL